jgi:hypothetical protein
MRYIDSLLCRKLDPNWAPSPHAMWEQNEATVSVRVLRLSPELSKQKEEEV